jgi:bacillithiol system protein YtxJ
MEWIELNSEEKLTEASVASLQLPVLLFKHSTTCSISHTALNRLERNWRKEDDSSIKAYYLDLHSHRDLSREIASRFEVDHQSPQVLILHHQKSVYNCSHFDIDYAAIKEEIERITRIKNQK